MGEDFVCKDNEYGLPWLLETYPEDSSLDLEPSLLDVQDTDFAIETDHEDPSLDLESSSPVLRETDFTIHENKPAQTTEVFELSTCSTQGSNQGRPPDVLRQFIKDFSKPEVEVVGTASKPGKLKEVVVGTAYRHLYNIVTGSRLRCDIEPSKLTQFSSEVAALNASPDMIEALKQLKRSQISSDRFAAFISQRNMAEFCLDFINKVLKLDGEFKRKFFGLERWHEFIADTDRVWQTNELMQEVLFPSAYREPLTITQDHSDSVLDLQFIPDTTTSNTSTKPEKSKVNRSRSPSRIVSAN
jgi:hypothetical protein